MRCMKLLVGLQFLHGVGQFVLIREIELRMHAVTKGV